MTEFITLGLLIPLAFAAGLLFERFGLPRGAAYVLVGALFPRELLGGFIDVPIDHWATPLPDVTLGLIAFLSGVELQARAHLPRQ